MTATSHAHTVPHAENWNAVQKNGRVSFILIDLVTRLLKCSLSWQFLISSVTLVFVVSCTVACGWLNPECKQLLKSSLNIGTTAAEDIQICCERNSHILGTVSLIFTDVSLLRFCEFDIMTKQLKRNIRTLNFSWLPDIFVMLGTVQRQVKNISGKSFC